ncbi:hypothetical protein AC1031_005840 [Aphanomyces cochlioides]|nr:hypothetical protein AC1031_005840 [Aphanomyces cochlioides]
MQVHYNMILLNNLDQDTSLEDKQKHLIDTNSLLKMSMAFLADTLQQAGIQHVYCLNHGMKAPLQEYTWFSRVFQLMETIGEKPSFAMDFGFDARHMASILPIPNLPHEDIWGYDPVTVPKSSATTTYYPLFSNTSGVPGIYCLTDTEEHWVPYNYTAVDENDHPQLMTTGIQITKIKLYSNLFHLLLGHNKARTTRFLLRRTTIQQARNAVASCIKFLKTCCNMTSFHKSGGCRIEVSITITHSRQLQDIASILNSCCQLHVVDILKPNFRSFSYEDYLATTKQWITLIEERIPHNRVSNEMDEGLVHTLHAFMNGCGYWSVEIAKSLNAYVRIALMTKFIREDNINGEITRLKQLEDTEDFLGKYYPEVYTFHSNENLWDIQRYLKICVSANYDMKKSGPSVSKHSPFFFARRVNQPIESKSASTLVKSKNPIDLVSRVYQMCGSKWRNTYQCLPKQLVRTLEETSKQIQPAPSTSTNDDSKIYSANTSTDDMCEKLLFPTSIEGLNKIKKRLGIQKTSRGHTLIARGTENAAMKFPSPNLDPNALCKQIWDKYGETWTAHYYSKKNRQLLGMKKQDIFKQHLSAGCKRSQESISTATKTSSEQEQRKRANSGKFGLTNDGTKRVNGVSSSPFQPCQENIDSYLFQEDNEVNEFNEAKKLLYLRIHPKYPNHFVLAPKSNRAHIWRGDRGSDDPNSLIRQMVLVYPGWRKIFALLEHPRTRLQPYDNFLQTKFGGKKKNWMSKEDNEELLQQGLWRLKLSQSSTTSSEPQDVEPSIPSSSSTASDIFHEDEFSRSLITQPITQQHDSSENDYFDQSIPSETSSSQSSQLMQTLSQYDVLDHVSDSS